MLVFWKTTFFNRMYGTFNEGYYFWGIWFIVILFWNALLECGWKLLIKLETRLDFFSIFPMSNLTILF